MISLLVCSFSSHLRAQENLIPNGSFEELDSCPNGGDDFFVKSWFNPTQATPDCFNDCNNQLNGNSGIPRNFAGYQNPIDGFGYIGIYTYDKLEEYREYVGCELRHSMTKGTVYSITMYVSLSGLGNIATNNLGVAFTNSMPLQNDHRILSLTSVPIYFENVILDTTEWHHLVWNYTATGSEQYMVIGNLLHDNETTLAFIDSAEPEYFSYYFIDQVSVVKNDIATIDFPTVITPNSDGMNDELFIENLNFPYSFKVYNRWGETVYSISNRSSIQWNGRSDGQQLSEGVYYYVFSGKLVNRSGFVQLFK